MKVNEDDVYVSYHHSLLDKFNKLIWDEMKWVKANTKASFFLCVAPTSNNNKNKYICTHSVKGLGISYVRKSLLTNAVQIRRLNLLPTPLGLFINDVNQKIDPVTKIGVLRPSLPYSNGTSWC